MSFFDESQTPDHLTYLSAYGELVEGGLKDFVDLLRREIQRRRSSMLVVDGLVSVQASADTDQAFRQFVHELQEIALATDCTMFLTTNSGRAVSPEKTMVDGVIELNDRLYGWQAESDLQVVKFRGSGFLRGRHSYQITQSGIIVHPRIEALLARPTRADVDRPGRASTGVERLNSIVGGGLPLASTTMMMGPSGTGKTTMGLHFLSRSSLEEPGLLFGFYETPARLKSKAQGVCPRLSPLLESGVVEHLWQPPTGDLLDAYGQRLLEAIHRRRVTRLFIDGLTSFKNVAADQTRIGNFFSALANELRVLGVTTIYSLEVPDILGPVMRVPIDDVSSLAENLILLRFVEVRSQLYRLISVLKVRDSDFDPSLFEFAIRADEIAIHESRESAEHILGSLMAAGAGATTKPARSSTRALKRGS